MRSNGRSFLGAFLFCVSPPSDEEISAGRAIFCMEVLPQTNTVGEWKRNDHFPLDMSHGDLLSHTDMITGELGGVEQRRQGTQGMRARTVCLSANERGRASSRGTLRLRGGLGFGLGKELGQPIQGFFVFRFEGRGDWVLGLFHFHHLLGIYPDSIIIGNI